MRSGPAIWIAAALFTLSVLFWIVYVPPFALDPMRALPLSAQLVSPGGESGEAVLKKIPFSREAENHFFVPGFCKKNPALLAVVPPNRPDQNPGWIAVSISGPRSFLLRWRLNLFPPDSVQRLASYGARPVWKVESPSGPSTPPFIRFTIAEGLILCTVSDNSHDIYVLLDTLDGRRPSQAERKEEK